MLGRKDIKLTKYILLCWCQLVGGVYELLILEDARVGIVRTTFGGTGVVVPRPFIFRTAMKGKNDLLIHFCLKS